MIDYAYSKILIDLSYSTLDHVRTDCLYIVINVTLFSSSYDLGDHYIGHGFWCVQVPILQHCKKS